MKVTDYMLTDAAQGGGVAAVAPVERGLHDDSFHRTMSSEECTTTFSWVRTTFPTSSSHFYGGQSKLLQHNCTSHRQPQPHVHPHAQPPSRPGYVASVRDDDVLLGRGRSHARRPANVRFRAIIEKHREPYFAANSMQEKKEMTELIVRLVGGRFLRSNQARTGWIEITGEAARVKVAQALQYRQRLLPKGSTGSGGGSGSGSGGGGSTTTNTASASNSTTAIGGRSDSPTGSTIVAASIDATKESLCLTPKRTTHFDSARQKHLANTAAPNKSEKSSSKAATVRSFVPRKQASGQAELVESTPYLGSPEELERMEQQREQREQLEQEQVENEEQQEPMIPEYVENDDLRWALETNPLHFVRRNQVLEELRNANTNSNTNIDLDYEYEHDDTAIGSAFIYPVDYSSEEMPPRLDDELEFQRHGMHHHHPLDDNVDMDSSTNSNVCQDLTKYVHEMRRYSLLASVMNTADEADHDLPESLPPKQHALDSESQATATTQCSSSSTSSLDPDAPSSTPSPPTPAEPESPLETQDRPTPVSSVTSTRMIYLEESIESPKAARCDDKMYATLAAAALKPDLSASMHSIHSIEYGDIEENSDHKAQEYVVPQHFTGIQFDESDGAIE